MQNAGVSQSTLYPCEDNFCENDRSERDAHQDPSQNELGSFISSQIPENSTPPVVLQFLNASVHQATLLFANQSGKTVKPGQTCPTYSLPSELVMKTFCSVPDVYGSYYCIGLNVRDELNRPE